MKPRAARGGQAGLGEGEAAGGLGGLWEAAAAGPGARPRRGEAAVGPRLAEFHCPGSARAGECWELHRGDLELVKDPGLWAEVSVF